MLVWLILQFVEPAESRLQSNPDTSDAQPYTHNCVDQPQNGLLPRWMWAQTGDNHDNCGRDSCSDDFVWTIKQGHRDGSDSNQQDHASQAEWKKHQVNQTEPEAERSGPHSGDSGSDAAVIAIAVDKYRGYYCPHTA